MGNDGTCITTQAERLRNERRRLGLTQVEFAKRAGVTVRSQRNYEAGARTPNSAYISALLGMGVDIGYVLDDLRSEVADPHEALIYLTLTFVASLGYSDDESGSLADQLVEAVLSAHEADKHDDQAGMARFKSTVSRVVEDSPVATKRGRQSTAFTDELDYYLLTDIIDGLERHITTLGRIVRPSQKALRIASLYRQFRGDGGVDQELLAAAARSLPTA